MTSFQYEDSENDDDLNMVCCDHVCSIFEELVEGFKGLVELVLDLLSTCLVASLGSLVQLLSCSELGLAILIDFTCNETLIEGLGQILNEFLSNLWQLLLSLRKSPVEVFVFSFLQLLSKCCSVLIGLVQLLADLFPSVFQSLLNSMLGDLLKSGIFLSWLSGIIESLLNIILELTQYLRNLITAG